MKDVVLLAVTAALADAQIRALSAGVHYTGKYYREEEEKEKGTGSAV